MEELSYTGKQAGTSIGMVLGAGCGALVMFAGGVLVGALVAFVVRDQKVQEFRQAAMNLAISSQATEAALAEEQERSRELSEQLADLSQRLRAALADLEVAKGQQGATAENLRALQDEIAFLQEELGRTSGSLDRQRGVWERHRKELFEQLDEKERQALERDEELRKEREQNWDHALEEVRGRVCRLKNDVRYEQCRNAVFRGLNSPKPVAWIKPGQQDGDGNIYDEFLRCQDAKAIVANIKVMDTPQQAMAWDRSFQVDVGTWGPVWISFCNLDVADAPDPQP